MKIKRTYIYSLSCVIVAMLVIPSVTIAQDSGQTEQPPEFTKEELTQMLAPIALYPDSLLSDILMASTYPVEIVEAERWLKQNKDLKGDELDRALQEKTWDSSVKSLCYFPDVLYAMSDKLDQTTKLGEAFLYQQDDVMNTVQELRRKASEQGNLKTTEEQKVIFEEDVIRIEPADTAVVYVPVYNPLYVYGPWWYPAYPPYYWYYPPGFIITGGYIRFGPRFFIGFGLYYWSCFDWHHHHIYIDIYKTKRFNRFDRGRWDFGRHIWRHNPDHKKGVIYRERTKSQHFEQTRPKRYVVSHENRGYTSQNFQAPLGKNLSRNIEKKKVPDITGRTIERKKSSDTNDNNDNKIEQRRVQRSAIHNNHLNSSGEYKFVRRVSAIRKKH